MKLTLQWTCPQTGHTQIYEKLLQVQMTQQEGFLPQGKVWVPPGGAEQLPSQNLSLLEGERIWLSNARITSCISEPSGCQVITLVPPPLDEAMRQKLEAHIQTLAPHHPLFETSESTYPCHSYPVLIEYDRPTGAYVVSPLYLENLDHAVLMAPENLQVTASRKPYECIHIHLEAQWIQPQFHLMDVGQSVGSFETLTPHELVKEWPREGQTLAAGQWVVVRSDLQIHDTRLTPLPAQGDETTFVEKARMQGELLVACTNQVKRTERVTLTLRNGLRSGGEGAGAYTLNFSLRPPSLSQAWQPGSLYDKGERVYHAGALYEAQGEGVSSAPSEDALHWKRHETEEVFDSSEATFFTTPSGQKALHHALCLATTRLMANGRCLRIKMPVSLDQVATLSTCQWVRVMHPQLPEGQAVGKVVGYGVHVTFQEQSAWVTVVVNQCVLGPYTPQGEVRLQEEEAPILPCDPLDAVTVLHAAADQQSGLETSPSSKEATIPITRVLLSINPEWEKRQQTVREYTAAL